VHYAAVPDLARSVSEATAANSLSGLLEGVSLFAGPVLAGVGARAAGYAVTLACSAAAAAVAAALTCRLGLRAQRRSDAAEESALAAALGGLRMMRADRAATALLLLVGVLALVIGALDVLSVAYADQQLRTSAAGAGLLVGAVGIGALFGAAGSVVLISWRRLSLAVAAGLVTMGLPLMVMSLPQALAPAVVLLAAAGLGKSFFDIAGRTLLQRTVEAGMLARVFGLAEAVKLTGIAVGTAVAPALVAALTASDAYLPLGAALARSCRAHAAPAAWAGPAIFVPTGRRRATAGRAVPGRS
jgi:hypothetical protein